MIYVVDKMFSFRTFGEIVSEFVFLRAGRTRSAFLQFVYQANYETSCSYGGEEKTSAAAATTRKCNEMRVNMQ